MMMTKDLAVDQLDQRLDKWRALSRALPPKGWLNTVRESLGMTTRQLAKAVGVSQGAVVSAEHTEASGDITLSTLRRYADALGCDVSYALVPKQQLRVMIEKRAESVARDHVDRVGHSMSLEDQATSNVFTERNVAKLSRRLIDGNHSRLWEK